MIAARGNEDQRPRRRLRADARASRAKIIASALRLFGQEGIDASLERVAAEADVGSATLHRHFKSRRELAEAVLSDGVDKLVASAHDFPDDDAGTALVLWLGHVIDHSNTFRGLAALLADTEATPATTSRGQEGPHARIRAAGQELLIAAQDHARVRHDITISDLLQLANGIAIASSGSPTRARKLLTLLFDGIRTTPNPPS